MFSGMLSVTSDCSHSDCTCNLISLQYWINECDMIAISLLLFYVVV